MSEVTRLADGIWLMSEPVSILGMRLTSTTTILRLSDGRLLLYSPVGFTPERRSEVDRLGPVAHLYAPSTFHHLHVGEWIAAYPQARLHAPAGLAKKRPDLMIDRVFATRPEPAFEDVVEEIAIDGFRLEERVLFQRPERTLIVADLVHNVGRPAQLWAKLYTRVMGFHDRVALSRMIRWTAFADQGAARRSIDALLALPIERLVVGHGAPVTIGAREALARAFDWLPTGN